MGDKKPKKTAKILKTKPLKLKISVPICIIDMGDGSSGVFVYQTFAEAETRAIQEENKGNGGAEAETLEITVDEEGNIIGGFTKPEISEDSESEPGHSW